MATEIERKFLVEGDYKSAGILSAERIVQGYICSERGKTVRIRIRGTRGYLTIKGPSGDNGLSRYEFEQEIPLEDAEQLFKLCEPGAIDKVRTLVQVGSYVWEVDEFHGANEGLVMAEVELPAEDAPFERPAWAVKEVTGDRRYYNSMLTHAPYTTWKEAEKR